MLSLHTGWDTEYLTGAVGPGRSASDYYTGEAGEPPGYWQGKGAAALGLAGEVDAGVMRRLYHEDIGPDGQVLARRQRPGQYQAAAGSLHKQIEAELARIVAERGPFITPEEIRATRLRLRSQWRNRVPFYDFTFSAPKSVSVLWASLLQAAAEAEAEGRHQDAERLTERAERIRGAVKRANDRMMTVAERFAYVRTGHHSATSGEFRNAEGFTVASFQQHTNRDADPQLHIHNAIGNRAQRRDKAQTGDEKWRALHGHPLFKEKLGLGGLGNRFLAQELEQAGVRTVLRADGNALEVGGITEEMADTYSGRAREVQARARELAAQYESKTGHAPGKAAWFKIKQRANLETRDAKDHNPPAPGQELRAWARKAARSGAGKLSSLYRAADAWTAEHAPHEMPSEAERARAIRVAVAEAQRQSAVWCRSQLLFELTRSCPELPGDVDPDAYFAELADEALSGRAEDVTVLQIAPVPDVIDVTRLGLREDGTSLYRPPGEERYVTKEHLDHEQWLVDVALLPRPQRITAEAAGAAVAGTGLDWSQREAVTGLLTSRRLIDCLIAPAGTGKTHTMAQFARVWQGETAGRVIGLTASENAARVMASEAEKAGVAMSTFNIAKFLGKIKDSDKTRGHVPVGPGDVLVVDEATQVSTEDALRIAQIARTSGAKIVATLDTEQLGSVDAGGIFPLIAARHGHFRLTEVRRFRHAWERDASLRIRRGDLDALAEYDGRGRIRHGPRDRVYDDAVSAYLIDLLNDRETLLLAATNEEAARLSALARERLIEMGRIPGGTGITLADGNAAGVGDLVRARLNTKIDADGQTLANRDTIRIDGFQDSAYGRLAILSRKTGPGQWSRQFLAPVTYLEEYAELDYAGNPHVAQGRTTDASHTVVSEGMSRSQLYVSLTRGREKNTLHVVTGEHDPAQPGRAEREAYTANAIARRAELRRQGAAAAADAISLVMPDRPSDRQMAPWEAVLAQVMQRDDPELTALEAMQAAQDYTTNMGHLLELQEAFWRLDVVPQIDQMIRERISERDFARYMTDPERPALLQALREHEIGGREIPELLDAITAKPLDGLRSIAAGLHGRAGKEPAPARGETTRWADRAPRAETVPEVTAAGQMMDARQAELGRQLAGHPQHWALQAWGVPPAEAGALREDWERRAGIVGAYREAAGITDPDHALGPAPAGQAQIREAFHASVVALQLADDQALVKAMGQGDLEAREQEYLRAAAIAPPDVQARISDADHNLEAAQMRELTSRDDPATEAETRAHAQDLETLAVADAARREWHEANADLEAGALAASKELQRRGLEARVAEAAEDRAAGSEPEPAPEAETEEEFQARLNQTAAELEGRPAPEAQPVEPEREPAPEPETENEFRARLDRMVAASEPSDLAREVAGLHDDIDAFSAKVDAMPSRQAQVEAQRAAEMAEPGPEWAAPEPEAALEATWEPGNAYPPAAEVDADAEMEIE